MDPPYSHVSFLKNKIGFKILFDITQKGSGKNNKEIILDKLVILFKGGRPGEYQNIINKIIEVIELMDYITLIKL